MTELRDSESETSATTTSRELDQPSTREPGHGRSRRRRTHIPGDASARFADVISRRGRASRNDGDTLLNSIVLDATELLGASRVAMMLYDPKDDSVEILDVGTPAFRVESSSLAKA